MNVPNPDLYYQSHFSWDTSDQSSSNDNDGIVDAGETIDLAVTIKNYWGQANNVVVTLSAQARAQSLQIRSSLGIFRQSITARLEVLVRTITD